MASVLSRIYPFSRYSYCTGAAMTNSFYDIIIIGGGMVGNAMACSIGLSERLKSKKVLILDSAEIKAPTKNSPYGNRVTAVSPPSISLFKKLGIWNDLVDLRVKRVDRLQVLDSCSNSSIRFTQPDPANEVAYMIENNAIIGFLSNRIVTSCPNVTVKRKTKVVDCRTPSGLDEFATVVLDDGTKLQTSLIIGADGSRSLVRDLLKFKYTSWGYGQSAIVANLRVKTRPSFSVESNCVAWERFTPSGPVALLPLTEDLSSVTWSTSTEHAEELLSLSAEEFVNELNQFLNTSIHQNYVTNQFLSFTGEILKGVFSVSGKPVLTFPTVVSLFEDTRAAFPLAFGHAHTYVIPRAALIGDAAHRTHPLAGQGVNLGWNDVRILVKCLEQCVTDGGDLGSLTYLADYDTKGQRRNVPVQIACDWLNRLYLASSTPFIFIRSFGLNMVDRFTPLKQYISYELIMATRHSPEIQVFMEEPWPVDRNEYELEEIIGSGSTAIVCKSFCKKRKEICAIKRVDLEKSDLVQIAKELTSMGGRCSIKKGVLNQKVVATILKEVLIGLEYIHDKEVLHGDVKTANILISSEGAVQLADFGPSVWVPGEERTKNKVAGTACYLAPELAGLELGEPEMLPTFLGDIWSLGIVALEMVTGYPPYHNKIVSMILKWVRENEPPNLETFKFGDYHEYGKKYRHFVSSCLKRCAKQRWSAKKLINHPFIISNAQNGEYLMTALMRALPYVVLPGDEKSSRKHRPPISDNDNAASEILH
uniref:Ubiquinone biosynthesis monooxygenase COQ6, mitochondrial n=1 Tax=Setaria digitata TaxID=48799 RepID=A0A915Q1S4_9BILA